MFANFSPPLGWENHHPVFEIPEWSALNCDTLNPQEMSRNSAILGETGSGKTMSAIQPLLRAALRYPTRAAYEHYVAESKARNLLPEERDDLHPALLVIDPKNELLPFVNEVVAEMHAGGDRYDVREVIPLRLNDPGWTIWFYEGIDTQTTNESDLIDRLLQLSIYLERETSQSREAFWGRQTTDLIRALFSIDLYLFKQGGIARLARFWRAVQSAVARRTTVSDQGQARNFQQRYDQFLATMQNVLQAGLRIEQRCKDLEGFPSEGFSALYVRFSTAQDDFDRGRSLDHFLDLSDSVVKWVGEHPHPGAEHDQDFSTQVALLHTLGDVLTQWPTAHSADPVHDQDLVYNVNNYLRPIYTLLNLSSSHHSADGDGDPVLAGYLDACKQSRIPEHMLRRIDSLQKMAIGTYTSVVAVVNGVLQELSSDELAQNISLNPFEPPTADRLLSIRETVDNGYCLVYSPGEDTDVANLKGRCIKSIYFELTFKRRNRIRPQGYFADEFQRFVTHDRFSGEQSYFDRNRGFRGFCVVATQSIASIAYRLHSRGSSGADTSSSALDILMNNTGNKLFFRNTDNNTHQRIKAIIPPAPVAGKPHLLDVRPLSALVAGECYYLFSSGRFGRAQVELRRSEYQEAQHRARLDEAHQRFAIVEELVTRKLGEGWHTSFSPSRSYQQFWRDGWQREGLWVHFEMSYNMEDLMWDNYFVDVRLHAEWQDRKKFRAAFMDHLGIEAPESWQDSTFAAKGHILTLLGRVLPLNGSLDDFLTQLGTLLDDVPTFVPGIDQALEALRSEA